MKDYNEAMMELLESAIHYLNAYEMDSTEAEHYRQTYLLKAARRYAREYRKVASEIRRENRWGTNRNE